MIHEIILNGRWHLTKSGDSKTIPAHVPGCVHTDLLAAGEIPDPFFRDNEDQLHWIGETDWLYSRDFQVTGDVLKKDRVLLHCDGLDTLAAIRLNGVEVGTADNMFRIWEFDIKPLLKPGLNHLEILFASPLEYIRRRRQERLFEGWDGPRDPKGRAWIRKMPCNFGWDWGIVAVTSGIWRDIKIVAFNTARLDDVHIRQSHSKNLVKLSIAVQAEQVLKKAILNATVTVSFNGKKIASSSAPLVKGSASLSIAINNPQLWWPNGMGAQPLYDVTVELLNHEKSILDSSAKKIGLRELRLDRHADEWGESFQFIANGIPFFAKGADWIPADAFPTRLTRANYAHLLGSVTEAHMNMLRLWGGGIYESDHFYDLCDELGICIWHDFMFACSPYPTFDDAWMANVKVEIEQQVRHLRHHASIALWCGNNELEQGIRADKWEGACMSSEDYAKLFDQLIPKSVRRLDPDRDYWPSSPHTPAPGDRKNFNDPTRGDAHLWDVWHGLKPFEWYRTTYHRFCSEFGFQSFPEPKTVEGYTAPQDRNVTSYIMEHHQRSGIGNAAIMHYMLQWYRLPRDFESLLWVSQIQQGMAMRYAIEHWRRNMPRCMGALYWQLNDTWPVASWASLDYHGRWKALQYMAKQFYAPLLISGVEDLDKGTVEVHVTSDRLEPLKGKAHFTITDLAGKVLRDGVQSIKIAPNASMMVETINLQPILKTHGPRNIIVWLELAINGEIASSSVVLFARPKHLELLNSRTRMHISKIEDRRFAITIESKHPALWAWLDSDLVSRANPSAPAVQFSDNFMHLRPGNKYEITATTVGKVTASEFKESLRVKSLVDTYE